MGGVGAHVILTLVPGDARVKRECSGSVLGPNAAAPATVTGEGGPKPLVFANREGGATDRAT